MSAKKNIVVRLIVGFGRFWWDFLVGDTPELFVAALVILGVVALTSAAAHLNTFSVVLEPLLVIAALTVSLVRVKRSRR